MDPATATLLVELASISLNAYFNFMKHAGKSEAEIDEAYFNSKKQFKSNKPEHLPPVPEEKSPLK